jgi:uncharacterized lipoprotein YmbA
MKRLIMIIALMSITSCATSKSCHTKGYYVSKSIKRAQAKPNAH